MNNDESSPVVAFEGTEIEAFMVKNLLENEKIEAWIWNQILGNRQALPIQTSVTVVVQRKNYEKAKLIIDEYYHNLK
jgi:hypothetical protein